MTAPLIVDPNEVNGAAAQWYELVPHFDTPPPNITGSGPESLAAQEAIAAAQAATGNLQQGLAQTAGTAQSAAGAYQSQEGQSAGGMKMGDVTGVLGDLEGIGTGLFGVVPQVLGAATGLVGSGAGVIGSLTGAATSLAKQGQGQQGEGHQGHDHQQENSNDTNPEDSYDYVHPEDAVFDGNHW